MEQGEGVVVEMEVVLVRLEIGCMGAYTPRMVYPTKVVGEHMAEMVDEQVGNGIEMENTKEKVWKMKDE